MDEDRQNGKRRDWFVVLFGAYDAFENTVDSFQVRWVGGEVDRDFLPLRRDKFPFSTEVVLDVAGTLDGTRVSCSFKFELDLSECTLYLPFTVLA